MDNQKVNTSKKHILKLYKIHVANYHSNVSRHSMKRNNIVSHYEDALKSKSLVIRDLNLDGKPFVMVLQCGPSTVPPHSWTLREVPWCNVNEVTED